MNISDPISDMLTRVRNAIAVRHASVALPSSQIKVAIATILREEGYIQDFEVTESGKRKTLRLWLKYTGERRNRQPVISGLQRVSRPGRRVYTSRDSIPWVLSGIGVAILSTPKGVMSGQQARRLNVGGEVLCYVW
jgi:small subunit ribosomal protein S8